MAPGLTNKESTQFKLGAFYTDDDILPDNSRRRESDPGERDMARLRTVSGQNRRLSRTLDVIAKNQETTRRQIDSEIRILRDEFVQRQSELLINDFSKMGGGERRRSSQTAKPTKSATMRLNVPTQSNAAHSRDEAGGISGINVEHLNAAIELHVDRLSRRRQSCHPLLEGAAARRCSTAMATGTSEIEGLKMARSRTASCALVDGGLAAGRADDRQMSGNISHKHNPGRKHSLAIVNREQLKGLQLLENQRLQREATYDDRFTQLMVSLQPKNPDA